jgi:hypothetical protein
VRVKDLYDLARILRVRPITNRDFWLKASEDFRLACESRYIDCDGLVTFHQVWPATRQAFEDDPTLPKDVPFAEAESALGQIVGLMVKEKMLPLSIPLPMSSDSVK